MFPRVGFPRTRPAPEKTTVRDPHVLRVVTYNVHSCVGIDGRVAPERIVEVLAALDPDVIGLQELDVGRPRTGAVDQAVEIGRALGMDHVFQRAVRWPDGDYGIAVLTRLPVHSIEGRMLPAPRLPYLQRRVALMVKLHHPDGDVVFVNTHLGLLRGERHLQIEFLVRWLAHVRTHAPTVLVGDLNAPPHAPECRVLDGLLADAFGVELHGRTFPVHFPVSRIDQIRVSEHLQCVGVAIPRNALTRVASDHFPVVADLRVRESYRRGGQAGRQLALEG